VVYKGEQASFPPPKAKRRATQELLLDELVLLLLEYNLNTNKFFPQIGCGDAYGHCKKSRVQSRRYYMRTRLKVHKDIHLGE